jgi:hypothetical protein
MLYCGLQVFKDGLTLTLKLLDMRIELPLSDADLLRNQIGALLQIATDVTHLMIPLMFNPLRSNDQTAEQFLLTASERLNTNRRDFSATLWDPRSPARDLPPAIRHPDWAEADVHV